MKNRILSLLLCCVMLLGLFPTIAFAEDSNTPEKVSVSFDVNDPDGTILKSVSVSQFSISYPYGSAVTVEPANNDNYCIWYNGLICEANDGIVFKEWNTQPDGTGTAYREGETISEALTQNLTLYAIWAQKAEISLKKTVVFPDGATPVYQLPEYFSFSLSGVSYYPITLYTNLDKNSEALRWAGSSIGRLVPGTEVSLLEEAGSASRAFSGYMLCEIRYYIGNSSEPIVVTEDNPGQAATFTLQEGTNTVRIVNVYAEAPDDVLAGDITIFHRVSDSDRSDWETSDSTPHKAAGTPSIDYRISLDLRALALTESGTQALGGYALTAGETLWNAMKAKGASFCAGSYIDLLLTFDSETLMPLTPENFSALTVDNAWFRLAEDEEGHPENAVLPLDKSGYRFFVTVYIPRDTDAAPSDTLTLSGITAALKAPLTDDVTEANPCSITLTAEPSGELYLGGIPDISMLSVEPLPPADYPLLIGGNTVSDRINLYAHTHSYTLAYDKDSHWQTCACGAITGKEAHRYGAWTVTRAATASIAGEKVHTCMVCNYQETAEIPVSGSETPAQSELSYDANGGTGTMSSVTGDIGSTVVVTQNGFTRNGYTFAGWNTQADGNGTAYHAGDAFTLTDKNTVLYAQWSKTPGGGDASNTGKPSKDATASPETGDASNLALWLALLLAGGTGISITVYGRKKNAAETKYQ